jgi:hypothetical protein
MASPALITIQARGKIRRFVQAKFQRERAEALVAMRQGECNRCGECCRILFRCPFLGKDAQGENTCRIYEKRFGACRLYPIQPADLREVKSCSYTFVQTEEIEGVPAPVTT